MKKSAILLGVFGFIVLLGGVFAYIKAGSAASLLMSGFFALLLFFSSFFCFKEKISGLYIGTFSSLFLNFFFLYRFLKSFKVMPAGMMVIISTGFAIPLIMVLTKKIKESIYE